MQNQLDLKVELVTDNIIDLPSLSSIELGRRAFLGYRILHYGLIDYIGLDTKDNVLVMRSIGLQRNVS